MRSPRSPDHDPSIDPLPVHDLVSLRIAHPARVSIAGRDLIPNIMPCAVQLDVEVPAIDDRKRRLRLSVGRDGEHEHEGKAKTFHRNPQA